jgi:hypothetical protein
MMSSLAIGVEKYFQNCPTNSRAQTKGEDKQTVLPWEYLKNTTDEITHDSLPIRNKTEPDYRD